MIVFNKKNSVNIVISFLLLLLGYCYYYLATFSYNKNLIFAILCIVLNIHIIYKCKNNIQLFLVNLIILYFNYSALINYYFFKHSSVLSFEQCNNNNTKGICIICLYIFMVCFDFFIDWKEIKLFKFDIYNKSNFTWHILNLLLLLIYMYSLIKRGSINSNSYQVYNIAIFEYCYLLFILEIYFSNKTKSNIIFMSCILIIFLVQDVYYGGRISSLEFILVFYIMIYYKFLNKKKIIFIIIITISLFTIVSIYRISYSFDKISLGTITNKIFNTKFALDSASNSYYSTLCAVEAHNSMTTNQRLENFIGFVINDIIGIDLYNYSELPTLIHKIGYFNIGGCWYIGYFYFWFGINGILFSSIILTYIINKLVNSHNNSNFNKLLYVVTISTIPRWYLYIPSALFRGIIIFTIIYCILYFVNNIKK